jgi:hypothetical protein
MKTLLPLFIGFCVAACVASASAELSSVPFTIGQQQFKAGDSIIIEQVLATSPRFGIGDKVVVRGRYKLASAVSASLGLFVTHESSAGPDSISQSQMTHVNSTAGSFELSCEIKYPGTIHVSFYSDLGGESFGGVYFSSNAQNTKPPNHSTEPTPTSGTSAAGHPPRQP